MPRTFTFRNAIAISTAVLASLVGATGAVAAPGDAVGGLIQLAPPHACIAQSATPTNPCGDEVNGGRVEGGLESAQSVAISPGGKNVYVASLSGAISTFDRNTATGVLTYKSCIKDPNSTEACAANSPTAGELLGAKSVGVSPSGNFVYVAASTTTNNTGAITVFARDLTTGKLTPVPAPDGCISQDNTGCHLVTAGVRGVSFISVRANSVYALSHDRSTLSRLARNADTGVLDLTSTTADCFRGAGSPEPNCGGATETKGLKGPSALAIEPGVDWTNLYVVSKDDNALAVFKRGTGVETITSASCERGTITVPASSCDEATGVAGLNGAQGIAADTANVYVAAGPGGPANTGNTLATFARTNPDDLNNPVQCYRDATSTAETSCNDAPSGIVGLQGARDVAISAEDDFVYVAAAGGSDVAAFSRNATNGFLTPLNTPPPGSDRCVGETGVNTDCPSDNRGAYGIRDAAALVTAPAGAGINSNHLYVVSPTDDAVAEFRIQRAPVCTNATIQAQHDQHRQITLVPRCTDANGDALTFSLVTGPTNGGLTVNGNGIVTYTPNPHFSGGNDSFTFRSSDGHVLSNVATLTIHVPPISQDHTAPVIHRSGIAAHMTRSAIVGTGIQFSERSNERVTWHNELLGKPRELGTGSSSSYSAVLATKDFGFKFRVPPPTGQVTLKMTNSQLPPAGRTFHVKVRIVATDANHNVTTKTKTVTVNP